MANSFQPNKYVEGFIDEFRTQIEFQISKILKYHNIDFWHHNVLSHNDNNRMMLHRCMKPVVLQTSYEINNIEITYSEKENKNHLLKAYITSYFDLVMKIKHDTLEYEFDEDNLKSIEDSDLGLIIHQIDSDKPYKAKASMNIEVLFCAKDFERMAPVVYLTKVGNTSVKNIFALTLSHRNASTLYANFFSKKFNLDASGDKSLRDFLNFKGRINVDSTPEEIRKIAPYYNMAIISDDDLAATTFINDVAALIAMSNIKKVVHLSEESITSYSEVADMAKELGEKIDEIEEGDVVVIEDICQRIYIDEDAGTGSSYEKIKKQQDIQNTFWELLMTYAKETPLTTFIVKMNTTRYRDTFIFDSEKTHRVWGHRIFVPKFTEEYIYTESMKAIDQLNIQIADDFPDALNKYIKAVYRKADLKGIDFINDLINRILSLFFRKTDYVNVLMPDCIPPYEDSIKSADEIIGELNNLVGLDAVKKKFQELYASQLADHGRDKKRMYHMMFQGNPGTGKTTVAEMVAKIYFDAGICENDHLVVVNAADLVSKWSGNSLNKTARKLEEAYGGVLFIDEAYSLLSHGELGQQILDYWVKKMDEERDRIIIILAGYTKELEKLFEMNKGLESRVNRINFENYNVEELYRIFLNKCNMAGYTVEADCKEYIEDYFNSKLPLEYFANGREAEHLFNLLKDECSAQYANDLLKYGSDAVSLNKVIKKQYFINILPSDEEGVLDRLVGLDSVKKQIKVFKSKVSYQKAIREKGIKAPSTSMHMIFAGNPGTGKTTVAKLIANDLYSAGVLKNKNVHIVTYKDLVRSHYGESAQMVEKAVQKAAGGILFIDEAYSLVEDKNKSNSDIIDTLLTLMEEHKEDTIFIFAGYTKEMRLFVNSNPGLKSRIPYHFFFEDYTVDQLVTIYFNKLTEAGFAVDQGVEPKLREIMEYFSDANDFGNGRFVDNLISMTISKRADRSYKKSYNDLKAKDIPTIKEIIEIAQNKEQLYDPDKITEEDKRRTAIHELGHAIVSYVLDPEFVLDSISITSRSKSLGRVTMPIDREHNSTEDELMNRLAVYLAGRNAERILIGNSDTGCRSDFLAAKDLAKRMVEEYAMGDLGITDTQTLLRDADKKASEIITRYSNAFVKISKMLLTGKEMNGSQFKKIMDSYMEKEKNKQRKS